MPRKFSKSATAQPPQNKTTAIYDKLAAGEKLDKTETESLECLIFKDHNMPLYKQAGWEFDFRPYLNRYLVNFKHLGWVCKYSTNKTAIRKNDVHKSWIIEIHEIPNKFKK